MKKGVIVEKGNHDSLLKDHPNGVYAKLVKQQESVEEHNNDEVSDAESENVGNNDDSVKVQSPQKYQTGKTRQAQGPNNDPDTEGHSQNVTPITETKRTSIKKRKMTEDDHQPFNEHKHKSRVQIEDEKLTLEKQMKEK